MSTETQAEWDRIHGSQYDEEERLEVLHNEAIATVRDLQAENARLRENLQKARDTFADLERFLRLIGREPSANACQIAKDAIDAAREAETTK